MNGRATLIALCAVGLSVVTAWWVGPRLWQAQCAVSYDPSPGFLSAYADGPHGENIPLSDGLGHLRSFRVTDRYREDGAFFDGNVYRPFTAENAGYLCRDAGARQSVFRHDATHFASVCQAPRVEEPTGRAYIATSVDLRDGDILVELFLSDEAEISGDFAQSTCSLARALQAMATMP